MHIRQTMISPGVEISKSSMIQAKDIQNVCVQVIHMHFVFDRLITKIIGGTDDLPALYATAS